MNVETINDNYEKFFNFCDSLNISVKKDNKYIDKEYILKKIYSFKTYMKKTLKMLDDYYNDINEDNFVIKLEKIYKSIKKYDNKINFIIDFINDELPDNQNSLFLDSDINLNLDIEIEDIKSDKKYLDEYRNS